MRVALPTLFAASLAVSLTLAPGVQAAEPTPDSARADPATTATPLYEGRPRRTLEQLLAECMELWEPATHMTKGEWLKVCKRNTQAD